MGLILEPAYHSGKAFEEYTFEQEGGDRGGGS